MKVVELVLYCQFSAKNSQNTEELKSLQMIVVLRWLELICVIWSPESLAWGLRWLSLPMLQADLHEICKLLPQKSFYKVKGIIKYVSAIENLYIVKWTGCRLNRVYYRIREYLKADFYMKIPLVPAVSVYTWRRFQC